MRCALVDANGYLQLAPVDYSGVCAAHVMTPDEVAFLSALTLDANDIALAFSWGFSVVVMFGLGLPYAVKICRDLIKTL